MTRKATGIAAVSAVALLTLGVTGCGGGGSSSSPAPTPANSLGLNGTYGGVAEDIEYTMGTISATVEDRSITRFIIDGVDQKQTSSITQLQSDIFEYLTSDGINGGFLTDPSKSYGVIVNEQWEFGVVQKGASAPYGNATILDLDGSWTGFLVTPFDEGVDARYPVTAICTSGICVTTATGPAVDIDRGVTLAPDITGTQSTFTFSHRRTLAFDGTFSNTLGGSGVGAAFLSKDKRFAGVYACPTTLVLNECDFGALVKD